MIVIHYVIIIIFSYLLMYFSINLIDFHTIFNNVFISHNHFHYMILSFYTKFFANYCIQNYEFYS